MRSVSVAGRGEAAFTESYFQIKRHGALIPGALVFSTVGTSRRMSSRVLRDILCTRRLGSWIPCGRARTFLLDSCQATI